jgi:hypothetical protein
LQKATNPTTFDSLKWMPSISKSGVESSGFYHLFSKKITNMKKKLLVLFGILPLLLSAQNQPAKTSIDPRIYAAYGHEYVDRIAQTNPFLIQYWTFYLDHAFAVMDVPTEKEDDVIHPVIKVANLKQINILQLEKDLQIKPYWDRLSIYRIANTEQLLVYYPTDNFIRELNEWRKTKGQ